MIRTKKPEIPLSKQIQNHSRKEIKSKPELDGNFSLGMISTGSTLLDLAISGGRIHGGGLPGGIFVEIFGPESSGKTVLLCEIAGAIQRQGGDVMFHDPEARLNKQFASLFDLHLKEGEYSLPSRVPDVFRAVRAWKPGWKEISSVTTKDIVKDLKKSRLPINPPPVVHGIFADSLAALSTELEMESEEGDKMGMRRAKEFSEELRRTCRIITQNNYLMVCSNQTRQSTEMFTKDDSPGGKALRFYSSLRIRANSVKKITVEKTIAGKEEKRVIGTKTEFEIVKSSVWKPYHVAPVTILFDYGIDDVRENLSFIKRYSSNSVYSIGGRNLSNSLEASIQYVEQMNLIQELKEATIDLWKRIEEKFDSDRKPKQR